MIVDGYSFCEFVRKTYSFLRERQDEIDQGTFVNRTPGRKKKTPYRNTMDLQKLIWGYFDDGLQERCSKNYKGRKDALSTEFQRLLKKLPLFLVNSCSAYSKYKSSELKPCLFSFLEAYISFSSLTHYDESDLIKDFAEFCMMCFEEKRCVIIIDALRSEGYTEKYCQKLNNMLKFRKKTARKYILAHMKQSRPWKIIFKLVQEVLEAMNYPGNKSLKALRTYCQIFLKD